MPVAVHKVATQYDSGAFTVEVFVGGKRRWIKTYFLTGAKKFDEEEKAKLEKEQEEVAKKLLAEHA